MNIKQALKRKNKLVGLMNEEFAKAAKYIVTDEGNPRTYSALDSITKWMKLSDELVDLKTKIHIANAPMYRRIFMLAELKNQVKYLKSIDCTSGKVHSRWESSEPTIKHAELNIVERDKMVSGLEVMIENIQDELDQWNHSQIIED
jgi:hypothetical protein